MEEKEVLETAARFGIDLNKLEAEQKKLSKSLKISDEFDFENIDRIAGIEVVNFKNKIIAGIVVIDKEFEVLEKQYYTDRIRFPYLNGFRAYRELPCMMEAFNLLEQRPDLVLIRGQGILHPRGLGLASHFSLSGRVASIGVAEELQIGEIDGEKIILNKKTVGKVLKTKEGGNPLYVSPGNLISLNTSVKIVKEMVRPPHKFPEPLRMARKYAKEVMEETAE